MRNIIFIVLLFLSNSLFAQNKNHFGIKAGYISSRIDAKAFNSDLNYSPRKLFSAGVAYNRYISEILDFQTELLLSAKGYKYNYTDLYFSSTGKRQEVIYSYNAECLELPILIKIHSKSGKLKPYINGGVSPSYIIIDNTYSTFDKFDLGLVGSFGIDIPLGKKIYTFLELRGNLGLIDVHTPIYSQSSHKTSSLYAFAGIMF